MAKGLKTVFVDQIKIDRFLFESVSIARQYPNAINFIFVGNRNFAKNAVVLVESIKLYYAFYLFIRDIK